MSLKSFTNFILLFIVNISLCLAANVPIEMFDLSKYSQNADYYIPKSEKDYDKPLLTKPQQDKLLKKLISHAVGNDSPWSESFYKKYQQQNNLKEWITEQINDINNAKLPDDEKIYKENFRLFANKEYQNIIKNINSDDINNSLKYNNNNRAIVTRTTMGYAVPYDRPLFLNFTLPGQGYPFSNINVSSLNIGEAVYIISTSKDKRWCLVLSSSFYAWVKSNSISRISAKEIQTWKNAFIKKSISIRRFETPVFNLENKLIKNTYPGTIMPVLDSDKNYYKVLLPTQTKTGDLAFIDAKIIKHDATKIPILPTPRNFVKIIKETQGYPYGWGNQYFYNDCSSELRAIYQAFGIWLPRNSKDQYKAYDTLNLDQDTSEQRSQIILTKARPFLDFIYIKGHVMLYIGKTSNPYNPKQIVPATYQQVWGLKDKDNTKRSVIGESVFLPLLQKYPEDPTLESELKKQVFRVVQVG
ncbi:SH3 domain-containing protein [Francisella sp. 19X1-34]|uniref:SH3 domain-containing protein n=1 Tax=Francisella sp. 19X1-34 TaxID=3087177 RepID=UPI002E3080D0|nr:SH3 domain-containing protein [Francisella sp. 19X1-34]MED7788830.1 SH3 domain-containing protein [Francisella sp. 19X1-34]